MRYFLLTLTLLFSIGIHSHAWAVQGVQTGLSIELGSESLGYEEDNGDLGIESDSTPFNFVLGAEAIKRWDFVFVGLKGRFPLASYDDEEDWTQNGLLIQTDDLEYKWSRADVFVGYPYNIWLNPYGGVRWSEATQERDNFVDFFGPIPGSVREKIRSWHYLLGIRGQGYMRQRWFLSYNVEYLRPINVRVTNTNSPGLTITDDDGYTIEGKVLFGTNFSPNLSLGFSVYAGRMHWEGSGWIPFDSVLVKWPENDTDFFGMGVNLTWNFIPPF